MAWAVCVRVHVCPHTQVSSAPGHSPAVAVRKGGLSLVPCPPAWFPTVCCTGRQACPRLWHGCAVSPLPGLAPLSGLLLVAVGTIRICLPGLWPPTKEALFDESWGAGNSDFIFECCGVCHFKCLSLDLATATQTWHRGASGSPYLLKKTKNVSGRMRASSRAKGVCLNYSGKAQRQIQEEIGYTMCQVRDGESETVEFIPRGGWLCLKMSRFQTPGLGLGSRGPWPVPGREQGPPAYTFSLS